MLYWRIYMCNMYVRLEYTYQCIRINPTVKYMYHVYPFVLATACAAYASKVLLYAAHTLAIC